MTLQEAFKKVCKENRTVILMWIMVFTILTTFLCFKQAYDFRSYQALGSEVVVPIAGGSMFFILWRLWR